MFLSAEMVKARQNDSPIVIYGHCPIEMPVPKCEHAMYSEQIHQHQYSARAYNRWTIAMRVQWCCLLETLDKNKIKN